VQALWAAFLVVVSLTVSWTDSVSTNVAIFGTFVYFGCALFAYRFRAALLLSLALLSLLWLTFLYVSLSIAIQMYLGSKNADHPFLAFAFYTLPTLVPATLLALAFWHRRGDFAEDG